MQKTANYQLSQYEADDRVTREDFNADNAAIDAALSGKPTLVTGSYVGDGSLTRTISLGFTPKIIFLTQRGGTKEGAEGYLTNMGFALTGLAMYTSGGFNYPALAIVDGGFKVSQSTGYNNGTNASGGVYYYIAVK